MRITRRAAVITMIIVVNLIMGAIPLLARGDWLDTLICGTLSAPIMIAGVLANVGMTEGWSEVIPTLKRLFDKQPVWELMLRRL